jgi:hypothetical protein
VSRNIDVVDRGGVLLSGEGLAVSSFLHFPPSPSPLLLPLSSWRWHMLEEPLVAARLRRKGWDSVSGSYRPSAAMAIGEWQWAVRGHV